MAVLVLKKTLFLLLSFLVFTTYIAVAVAAAADDEWGAPEVESSAAGRDEEARRRLMEIETWIRKQEGKSAKEAEEAAEKVKFDFHMKYKARVNVRDNLHLNNPGQFWEFDDSTYFDQRFQFGVDAEYGPLSAVFLMDKGNFVFDWKEGSEGTLERWGEFTTVTAALIRELYAQYTGPFVVKVGRQITLLGNGGIAFEGPVDALKLTVPLGNTPLGRITASASYMAVAGGFSDFNDFRQSGGPPAGDRSALLGFRQNEIDGYLLSLDIRPNRNLKISPYILKVTDGGDIGDPDLNLDRDFDASTVPRDGDFEPIWAGLALSGKTGNFTYLGDAIYLTGTFTDDRDLEAYAFMARGDYHFEEAGPFERFSLGLEFGTGSGNTAEEKLSGTGDSNDFIALFTCKERRKFGNIFSEDLRAGFFFADSNLANVTFARAIAEFEPLKDLRTYLSFAKLWTTESVFEGRGPVNDWSNGEATSTDKTRDIGWELDLNFEYPILKRLYAFAELGYFVPGEAYKRPDGQDADPAKEAVLGIEFIY